MTNHLIVACPHCLKKLSVPGGNDGKYAKCPLCKGLFLIPSVEEPPALASTPQQRTDPWFQKVIQLVRKGNPRLIVCAGLGGLFLLILVALLTISSSNSGSRVEVAKNTQREQETVETQSPGATPASQEPRATPTSSSTSQTAPSKSSTASAPEMSAWGLWEAYGQNSARADLMYKGKRIKLSGSISFIRNDERGSYIGFAPSQAVYPAGWRLSPQEYKWNAEGYPANILCYLSESGKASAANVAKGKAVNLLGKCQESKPANVWKGYVVILTDCEVVD